MALNLYDPDSYRMVMCCLKSTWLGILFHKSNTLRVDSPSAFFSGCFCQHIGLALIAYRHCYCQLSMM